MVGRNTVDAAYRHLATLTAIERTSPQWSGVIANLSESVPDDAYLSAIRGRGDSLLVDGLASHAARVFDAVEKTSGLVDVRAAAAVRRELQDDGKALEHFTIAARALPAQSSQVTHPASLPTGRRSGQ
jgi:Tfp pilus assembly protein PilN